MQRIPKQTKPKSWLWSTLTSIRLTVILLLVLAAVAVIGTVIPQGQPEAHYLTRYGTGWGGILFGGGFTNVYFSPWFLLPIILLALNITACLINGLPQAIRRTLKPLTKEAALALPERGKVNWPAATDPRVVVEATLRHEWGKFHKAVDGDKEIYFYERGRLRPLGPYLVHLALLLILAGGLIGKFWGIEGSLPIEQGETAAKFQIGQMQYPLDFQVRLDKFQVQFYEKGGTPKEFRSDLTFFKDGKEVFQTPCRVNEPVTFGKYTFYQASYGSQAAGPIRLKVDKNGKQDVVEAPLRRLIDLPGGSDQLMVIRAEANLQGFGPAAQVAISSGSGHPAVFWVLKDHPEMAKQPAPYHVTLESAQFQYYSVFQVKHDPGVPWVYAGFILFLPGFYLAFFRPGRRWALVLEPAAKGGRQARLLGAAPRNREEFAATQERILSELKRGTPS
jgi:cytochrome c biogenesis protein